MKKIPIRLQIVFTILLLCVLNGSAAYGDDWVHTPEVKETEFVFGSIRIVLHYDSTGEQIFPKYSLRVYSKERLVGDHKDLGFERIFGSSDNAYFLGVSNSGLIKHAYVIFDRNGRVLLKQPHNFEKVKYCSFSITVNREWYDKDNANVTFGMDNGRLEDITINGCDGVRRSLMTNAE